MKFISITRQKYKYIILFLFALMASSILSDEAVKKDGTLDSKLDSLVETYKAKTATPGLSVLVAKQGKIIYQKSFGLANIEHDIKVKNDTAFPIGSLSKPFTGFAILQLVEAGKLSLDDKLEKYFPDYPNGDKIFVRNLLNHTSGIRNYIHDKEFNEQVRGKQSSEQMIAWFKDKPFVFEPGTRWNYTNSGIYLLGLIIEQISKVSYAEYLKEHVFVPFEMKNTYVAGSSEIIPNRASGYSPTVDGYKNAQAYDVSIPFSAGAIISTVADMWKFMNNVHRSDNVSTDLRNLLYQQEILPNGEKTVYTLGCLFSSYLAGHKLYSHPGAIYGYTSHEAYYPDDDLYIVILTNGEQGGGPASLTQKMSRAVLDIPQPEYVAEEIPQKEMSRLAGNYYFTAQTFVDDKNASIAFNNGMLMFSMGDSKEARFTLPFTSAGNGLYIMIADDEITLKVDSNSKSPLIVLNYDSVNLNLKKLPN